MGKFDYSWQFYVYNYFPFIYGLYLIEMLLKQNDITVLEDVRKDYFEKVKDYFDQNNIFYEEDKLLDLLDANIKKEFGALLLYLHPRYKDNKCVKDLEWLANVLVIVNNEGLYDYEDTAKYIKENRIYNLLNKNNKKYLYIDNGSLKYYDGNKQYLIDDSIDEFKNVEGLGVTSESIGIVDVKINDFKYYIVYWEHCYPYDHYFTIYESPCATFEEAVWLAKKIEKVLPNEMYRYRKDDSSREYIFANYRKIGIKRVEEELLRHSSHQKGRKLTL